MTTKQGRPRTPIPQGAIDEIKNGRSINQTARAHRISFETLRRYCAAHCIGSAHVRCDLATQKPLR